MKTQNILWYIAHVAIALLITFIPYSASTAATRDEVVLYVNDTMGSAVAAYDENGTLCWEETYTPYGSKTKREDSFIPAGCGVLAEERGFTGHTEDIETDLVYMQQRYYDPTVGRFLSIDPLDANPNDPLTLNRYAYANNNPLKYFDPDGRSARLFTTSYKLGRAAFVQYRRAGKLDAKSVKDIGLDEIAGIAEDLNTLFGSTASPLERVVAAAELVSGIDVPKGAFEVAREGGRNAGQLAQFMKQNSTQLGRSIRKFDKNIAKHEKLIADPKSKIPDWDSFSAERQANTIHHWQQDIARAREQQSIAREVAKQKGF